MKGCKYCRTPHQDILTFTVGEDKDGYKITGHIDCDGQGLRYFDDLYEGGMCERANINFCPMCGRDLRKEDEGKMKKQEAILVSAYTGFLLTKDFSDVHKFCEDLLGRPIWTHEFASKTVQEEIKEKCRPLILELVENEIDTDHPTVEGGEQE